MPSAGGSLPHLTQRHAPQQQYPSDQVDSAYPAAVPKDPTARRPRKRRPDQGSTALCMKICCGAMACFVICGLIVVAGMAIADQAQLRSQNEQEDLRSVLKNVQKKLETTEQDSNYLKTRLLETETDRGSLKDQLADNTDTKKLEAQIDRLQKYKSRMHKAIQSISKMEVLRQFGPGPHRVEILVDFSPESAQYVEKDTQNRIVMELAPLDDMPHANYWFLSQVTQGLYDGCSFHRNAGHVVQGGPSPNHLSEGKGFGFYNGRFQQAGLTSILFQEYSPKFPHVKYTMGYAGRPGGPDMYISTRDNTKNHGPGGQGAYEDPTEADPCFAKVVEGFDVVDRMHQADVQPGGYKHMVHNVAIKHMKLLPASTDA